jgi:hypothetical protein
MQASFLASLVEFVEALTVVFAVGTVSGWRPALAGTALAFVVLLTLVVVLGQALTRIPSRSRAASSSAPSCSWIDGSLGIEAIRPRRIPYFKPGVQYVMKDLDRGRWS